MFILIYSTLALLFILPLFQFILFVILFRFIFIYFSIGDNGISITSFFNFILTLIA